MKDGELKKLRREDLLLILIEQQKQIETLTETLKQREQELENHRVAIDTSGSLAEAAFKLNDVYATTQKAADTYLNEMNARADEILESAQREADEIMDEADNERRNADAILEKARAEAEAIIEDARKQAERLRTGAPVFQDEEKQTEKPRRRGLFGRRG